MNMPRAITVALASCAIAASSFAVGYLKIGDIKGESTDRDHKDWIIIESMSVDKDVNAPRDAASGLATGKRMHKPFVITKELDKSSPKLAEACAKGTVVKEAEVGGPGVRYKLKDVIISSIQPSSSGGHPTETISLNYEKIEVSYDKDKKAAGVRESPTRASTGATAKPARAPN